MNDSQLEHYYALIEYCNAKRVYDETGIKADRWKMENAEVRLYKAEQELEQ